MVKIVLGKIYFQRGFELFKNISFIRKNTEHQKIQAVKKIWHDKVHICEITRIERVLPA